ncbi:fluoride efflux transporter FluC [Arthrobacter roseus]|uniref:fluoride efflux transporter FluC n=1 Tax=Arthrobacter roseus TaxID=136274 RepID=UPI00196680FD|nr:CrcB family protein [Arthrobacter roseus]MBM7849066.1 CrcB protein [Arthrobacter roseus]
MTGFWLALTIGSAGAVGGLLRFGLDSFFAARQAHDGGLPHWPWATFVVNAVGSTLIGLVFGWYSQREAANAGYEVVGIGLAGGLTTFSSWTVATVKLWMEGRQRAALGNVLANIIVGWGCAVFGIWVTSSLV